MIIVLITFSNYGDASDLIENIRPQSPKAENIICDGLNFHYIFALPLLLWAGSLPKNIIDNHFKQKVFYLVPPGHNQNIAPKLNSR